MIILKDRVEDIVPQVKSRFDPIPEPYMLHIRERFNDDGTVETVHRKRVYNNGTIVNEELET